MTNSQPAKGFLGKHYAVQAKKQCNTCSTATWVINREHHLHETRKKRGPFLKNFIRRMWTSKLVEPECLDAPQVCAEAESATCTQCKILVVNKSSAFSDDVMEYALDMASKTRSSLVALNLYEKSGDLAGFRTDSEKNVSAFSCKADDAGVKFSHVVKQGTEDAVVSLMYTLDPAFRYVIDDVVCEGPRKNAIPVYTRATLRAK